MPADSRSLWKNVGGGLAGLAISAFACWLLYQQLRGHDLAKIWQSFRQIGWEEWLLASALFGVHWVIVSIYEQVGLKQIGKPLPLGKLLLGSFVAYALGNALGWVIGAPLGRWRLYTKWGLTAVDVVRISAILGITFWVGLHAIPGVLFMALPLAVPEALRKYHLPVDNTFWPGALFVALAVVFVFLCAIRPGGIKLLGWQLELPSLRRAVPLLALVGLDLAVTGLIFYVLLPVHDVEFLQFLDCFFLAMVVVYLSHVPGGVGVLEASMLALLSPPESHLESVAGGMLAFRVFFYLAPLAISTALLVGAMFYGNQPAEMKQSAAVAD